MTTWASSEDHQLIITLITLVSELSCVVGIVLVRAAGQINIEVRITVSLPDHEWVTSPVFSAKTFFNEILS